jgi:hypothetical protein
LEAFARLMPQAPEQLVPLISTSFECMAAIPLEQNGQLPPPAKVTWRWKEEAMARISMAKVCAFLLCLLSYFGFLGVGCGWWVQEKEEE